MAEVTIQRIARHRAHIPIVGTAPLILSRFDEKSRQQMLDAQQGKKAKVREPKNPEQLFNSARYLLPDGTDGIPALHFKAATVGACRILNSGDVNMTLLRQALYFEGDGPDHLLRLDGPAPKNFEAPVRNAKTADIRFRPMFDPWRVTVVVEWPAHLFGLESLVNLVDAGGFGGVGEWRPAAKHSIVGGVYGTFRVDSDQEIIEEEVR